MATLTVTVPDAQVPRVIAALAEFYGVAADPQSVRQAIANDLKAKVVSIEASHASSDITITP